MRHSASNRRCSSASGVMSPGGVGWEFSVHTLQGWCHQTVVCEIDMRHRWIHQIGSVCEYEINAFCWPLSYSGWPLNNFSKLEWKAEWTEVFVLTVWRVNWVYIAVKKMTPFSSNVFSLLPLPSSASGYRFRRYREPYPVPAILVSEISSLSIAFYLAQ